MSDRISDYLKNMPIRTKCTLVLALFSGLIITWIFQTNDTRFFDPDPAYFREMANKVLEGLIPYRDFDFAFPPVLLIFITIPALVTDSIFGYRAVLAIMAFFFVIGTYYISLRTVERWKGGDTWTLKLAVPTALFILAYFPFLINKSEVFVIFFVAAGLYLYMSNRRALGYIVMIIAAFTKIYPALFIAVFLVSDLYTGSLRERLRSTGSGLAICLLTVAAVCVPLLLMHVSFSEIFQWIGMHNARGFQVESTVAVFVEFFGMLGAWSYTIVDASDTHDVVSAITDALAPSWYLAILALLILVMLCILYHAHQNRQDFLSLKNLSLYTGTIVLMFVISNKVFSTQYMVWLLPLFFFPLFMEHRKRYALYILLIGTMVLSLFHDPKISAEIQLLFIRNTLLMILEVYLILYLLGRTERMDRAFERIADRFIRRPVAD